MRLACILELAGSHVEGGRDVATLQLVEHLRQRGISVSVFSFADGIPHVLPRLFRQTPVLRAVSAFPLAGRKILRAIDGDYDLIWITSTSTASLYRSSTPTVLYCHSVIASKWKRMNLPIQYRLILNRFSQSMVAWVEKRCIKNVDAILAVSAGILEYVEREMGIRVKSKYVLQNGVDTGLFSPAECEGKGVIFVGRATIPKGFNDLLEAAPSINAPVTAIISKAGKRALRMAERAGIRVFMNVPHQEMPSFYRQASVFLLPSLDEEHPLVTLEAMACGLPVVATRVAAADMIENGEGGIIIPPRNPKDLSDAVNQLLSDGGARRAMGKRNRLVAEEKYSWDKVASDFIDISQEVMSRVG